jgi:hypothetical protein
MADAPNTLTAAQELIPATPLTPAAAAARLRQMEADPKWREGLLSGAPQIRDEFEALTKIAAAGDGSPDLIETVDAVTDPHALPRAAYAGLIDGLREQGLPQGAEQYMRDIDAGRRTDRPTAGDGAACKQALDRLIADVGWRQRYESGDIGARNLAATLSRVIAYAAADDRPITAETDRALISLGLR